MKGITAKLAIITLFGSAPVWLLTGCGERLPTVREICTSEPQHCTDLNQDSWCRAERRQLIVTRYLRQHRESASYEYYLLKDLQNYSQCIERASSIEHRELKDKQSHRIQAYLNSIEAINEVADATANSEHPLLMYWHWGNRADQQALEKLLALEHTPQMQTHELQLALATYYAKQDQQKMINQLYRALRLYQPDQRFNVEIPESIVTYYLKQKDVKNAYIWAQVAIAFNSSALDNQQMKSIVNATPEQYERWEEQAAIIVERLEDGVFKAYPDEPSPQN